MKEACIYLKESRYKRNQEHRLKVLDQHGLAGFINGFTEKELRKVKTPQKSSFNKGKKAAYNRIWCHNNLPRITKNT